MNKLHIKTGDTVILLTGDAKDRGDHTAYDTHAGCFQGRR